MNEVEEGDWKIVTSKKQSKPGLYGKNPGSNSFEDRLSVWMKNGFSFSVGFNTFILTNGYGSKTGLVLIRKVEQNKERYSSIWVRVEILNLLKTSMVKASTSSVVRHYDGYTDPETGVNVSFKSFRLDRSVRFSHKNNRGGNTFIEFPSGGWEGLVTVLDEILRESTLSGLCNKASGLSLREDTMINEVKSRFSDYDLDYERSVVTSSVKENKCDDGSGGEEDVKSEEDDERRGGGDDALLAGLVDKKSWYFSEFLPGMLKAMNRPSCLYGETDIESSDDKNEYESDNGYEIDYAEITTWSATMQEAYAEVNRLWKEDLEKMEKDNSLIFLQNKELDEKKKKKKNKKKVKHNRRIRLMDTPATPIDLSSIRYSARPGESTEYKIYVDACFKRNRKPRYEIIVQDPYDIVQFGFVGESKSRRLPQLQTHLEGMVKGVELVNDLIEKSSSSKKELRIYVHSNKSYIIDFASSPGRFPEKSRQFTEDVKRMLKKMIVDSYKYNLFLTHISYYENRGADYLARSTTSKVGERIPKEEFDKELRAIIEELARYEDVKRTSAEGRC